MQSQCQPTKTSVVCYPLVHFGKSISLILLKLYTLICGFTFNGFTEDVKVNLFRDNLYVTDTTALEKCLRCGLALYLTLVWNGI